MGVCVSEYSTRIRGSEIAGELSNNQPQPTNHNSHSPMPASKLFPRTSTEMELFIIKHNFDKLLNPTKTNENLIQNSELKVENDDKITFVSTQSQRCCSSVSGIIRETPRKLTTQNDVTTFSDKISLLEKFRRLKVGSFEFESTNVFPPEDCKFEVTSPTSSQNITLSEENSIEFVEDKFLIAKPMVPYRLSLVSTTSETELIKYLESDLSESGLKLFTEDKSNTKDATELQETPGSTFKTSGIKDEKN